MASRRNQIRSRSAFVLVSAAVHLTHSAAPAEAAPVALELSYDAPPECPNAAALRRTIAGLATTPRSEPLAARVVIRTHGAGFVSRIATKGGERILDDSTCDGVARATAVVLALALNPHREPADTPHPPPQRPGERGDSVSSRSSSQLRLQLGASLAGAVGTLPRPDAGVSAYVAIEQAWLRGGVQGTYWLPQREASESDTTRGGDFSWWTIWPNVCVAPALHASSLSFCVGPEVGRMRGKGYGVMVERSPSTPWLAILLAAEYALRIADHQRLRPSLGIATLVVGYRPFVLDDAGEVHHPARISARAGVGWEVVF